MRAKILIVEDNQEVQILLRRTLTDIADLNFSTTIFDAWKNLKASPADLCLVDISLPDGDGLSFCSALKNNENFARIPIFFLTAKTLTTDKVQAFQMGAEDYITKPFDPTELRARIGAKLRRMAEIQAEQNELVLGNLRIVAATQRAFIRDDEKEIGVDLSSLEFRILHFLAKHEDHVISRAQMLDSVWGENMHVGDRAVDTHVSNLRKKIAGAQYSIVSIKGAGYSLRKQKVA